MKILLVSDSHGRSYFLEKAILRTCPFDYLIHLGDVEGDEDYIREITPCPVYMVSGNNDFFSREPKEQLISLGGYKIMLTHGHLQNVYMGTDRLKEIARSNGAQMVLYGHTHVPKIDQTTDIWAVNPGSISLPRQEGRKPSYAVMEIDSEGKVNFNIYYIE